MKNITKIAPIIMSLWLGSNAFGDIQLWKLEKNDDAPKQNVVQFEGVDYKIVKKHDLTKYVSSISSTTQDYLEVFLNESGKKEFEKITTEATGAHLGIVVDGKILAVPIVAQKSSDGKLSIYQKDLNKKKIEELKKSIQKK